jgi:hypothetical protein
MAAVFNVEYKLATSKFRPRELIHTTSIPSLKTSTYDVPYTPCR